MAARLRPHQQESVKDKIQTTQLTKRLQNHALGILELSATQIKAAEILLARTMPTLSAVEQTTIDESAKLSESDLLAQLAELIRAHPDLVQQALAQQARDAAQAIEQDAQRVALVPDVPRETLPLDAAKRA